MAIITFSEALSKLYDLERRIEDPISEIEILNFFMKKMSEDVLQNYAVNRPRYNYYFGNLHFQLALRYEGTFFFFFSRNSPWKKMSEKVL